MPFTLLQRAAGGSSDAMEPFADQFTQFPHDLVGTVDSVTVAPDQPLRP